MKFLSSGCAEWNSYFWVEKQMRKPLSRAFYELLA
jgi:hypothetical protein